MIQVLISIGSNVEKKVNIERVLRKLASREEFTLVDQSRVYETVAVGSDGQPANQPTFYNLAAQLSTKLDLHSLKACLRQVEKELGRVRTEDKFAARPIDLDIVFYGPTVIAADGDRYPDPAIGKAPHVLCPLAEIAPQWSTEGLLVDDPSDLFSTLAELSNHLLKQEWASMQIVRIFES